MSVTARRLAPVITLVAACSAIPGVGLPERITCDSSVGDACREIVERLVGESSPKEVTGISVEENVCLTQRICAGERGAVVATATVTFSDGRRQSFFVWRTAIGVPIEVMPQTGPDL